VVNSGAIVFTLIGFAGLYSVVGLLYISLFGRELRRGPAEAPHD
jgi:cytochrome bd-type quinol oxidase subunit 1